MKKKIYNSPVTEFVDIELLPITTLSASDNTGGSTDDEEDRGSSDGSNANEYAGGSWENIWSNMQ